MTNWILPLVLEISTSPLMLASSSVTHQHCHQEILSLIMTLENCSSPSSLLHSLFLPSLLFICLCDIFTYKRTAASYSHGFTREKQPITQEYSPVERQPAEPYQGSASVKFVSRGRSCTRKITSWAVIPNLNLSTRLRNIKFIHFR